jgi:RND family efflux transporter MFP subunit
MTTSSNLHRSPSPDLPPPDEGGLRPPPGLSFWRRVWWWFDFLILVKIARLRFVAILLVIGLIITQWDTLIAYYEKWTRPAVDAAVAGGAFEWFCPMHPSIIRDNPKDKCPICFMPLSKRKKGDTAKADPLPPGIVSRVQLSPYRVVLAGVSTWRVDYVPLAREVVLPGLVEFNEREQRSVPAWVDGRIDKLLVNETGQMVEKDDVLAEIYSRDLVVTAQNLITASKANNPDFVLDSRTRLERLGIDKKQIDEILATGQAPTHLKIRSPIGGHVIQKFVREGQYVQEGMPLYEIADLSKVWIQAQVYEDDISLLPASQVHPQTPDAEKRAVVATTRAFPNEEFHGTLSFIYPHVDQATRTLSVRFEIDNPDHKLRPGGTATVRLHVAPRQITALAFAGMTDEQKDQLDKGYCLAVPASAIIDTGDQKIVYRQASPGVFEGVRVSVGPKMHDPSGIAFLPVTSGLNLGDEIVTSGSFLIDAETRLNPAAGSIYFGGSSGAKSPSSSTVRTTTPEDPAAKITAALAKLPPADKSLAEQQRHCAVLSESRLGSMGVPLKLTLGGETVFLCCAGCKDQALASPDRTIAKAKELRSRPREGAQP